LRALRSGRQRTNNRATVNTGTWSVASVNVDRRSSSVTLLSCRWSAFVWLTTAICVMAQSGGDRYPVVRNGKVGFIDSHGNEVIAPQFFRGVWRFETAGAAEPSGGIATPTKLSQRVAEKGF